MHSENLSPKHQSCSVILISLIIRYFNLSLMYALFRNAYRNLKTLTLYMQKKLCLRKVIIHFQQFTQVSKQIRIGCNLTSEGMRAITDDGFHSSPPMILWSICFPTHISPSINLRPLPLDWTAISVTPFGLIGFT